MARSARHSRRKVMSEMNVVPYIDVMLVLLVIFMITTPLLTEGVQVNLPDGVTAEQQQLNPNEKVVVTVDAQGLMYLDDDQAPIGKAELQQRVAAIRQKNPIAPVYVKGDADSRYASVVEAMTYLQQAGVANVSLVFSPIEEN